jgi:hypothetical protein
VSQDPDTIARPVGATAEAPITDPDRPELYVAGAFVGAFLFARILKKIAD